jgi:hypothetical protein
MPERTELEKMLRGVSAQTDALANQVVQAGGNPVALQRSAFACLVRQTAELLIELQKLDSE